MENRKYEITDITMEFEGRRLYRIRALKDFSDVKKGDLGGWVESEYNLSQNYNCWIYDEAKAMDRSRMYGDSAMHDYSKMYDYSTMYDGSEMYDSSEMHDYSEMYDNSKMFNNSEMYERSTMYDYARMHNYSEMYGDSEMHRNSVLKDKEKLHGKLVSEVDNFIDIYSKKGRLVTGVLKEGRVLFNVGCQDEITKEVFIDRIYNEDGGIEKHPYRVEYLKIIDTIEVYLSK